VAAACLWVLAARQKSRSGFAPVRWRHDISRRKRPTLVLPLSQKREGRRLKHEEDRITSLSAADDESSVRVTFSSIVIGSFQPLLPACLLAIGNGEVCATCADNGWHPLLRNAANWRSGEKNDISTRATKPSSWSERTSHSRGPFDLWRRWSAVIISAARGRREMSTPSMASQELFFLHGYKRAEGKSLRLLNGKTIFASGRVELSGESGR